VVNKVDILTETSIDEGSLQSRYKVHDCWLRNCRVDVMSDIEDFKQE